MQVSRWNKVRIETSEQYSSDGVRWGEMGIKISEPEPGSQKVEGRGFRDFRKNYFLRLSKIPHSP
jgi:hypothetical protein